jgi:hypothetical protein
MFVFDPRAQKINYIFPNNLGQFYTMLSTGPDAPTLWVVFGSIFTIDEQKRVMKKVDLSP